MSSENYFGRLSDMLISGSDSPYSETVGYTPVDMVSRDPEDSDLDWNFHSEPENSRLLKRYPPKLLDRAAEVASSDTYVEKELWLEDKYLGVKSGSKNCRLILENQYGAAAVEAYNLDDEVFFTEYLADEREGLDFSGEPERAASATIPEEIVFEDFFEDAQIRRDMIVVKDQ